MAEVAFGIFDHIERRDAPLGELYEGRLRLLEAADAAGFYCYHLAEHHGTPLGMAPSPGIFLAAAAQRTRRIHLGPLVYLLPLYNPLRLAEEICMLDQLSGGRVQMGVGRGVSPIEMGFFNIDPANARSIFDEDLAIMLQAFASRSLSYSGEHHHYHDVPMALSPFQLPHPPIWYPTSSVTSVAWVARRRYQTVFLGSPAHIADGVKAYRDNLDDPDDFERLKVGMLRYVFVADGDAEAMRYARAAYAAHLANLRHLANTRGGSTRSAVLDASGALEGDPEDIEAAVAKGWAAVGSPETVQHQLREMIEATGCNYLVFNPLLADTPVDRAMAATRLFGEEIAPALRASS